MMLRRLQFAVALSLLAGLLGSPLLAQRGVGQGKSKRQPAAPRVDSPRSGKAGVRGEGAGRAGREFGAPPQFLERLRELPPNEQERILRNNQRFQNLPAERQAEIRRRLQQWNGLTPDQREAIRERERVWSRMSDEERRRIRENIFPRWQQLSADRKRPILRRLHALHNMSESERATALQDERFLSGLNDDDRELLRELSRLRLRPEDQRPSEETPPLP